jgi:hypothetical protein
MIEDRIKNYKSYKDQMTNRKGFYATFWQKKLNEAFKTIERFTVKQDRYLLMFERNCRNI